MSSELMSSDANFLAVNFPRLGDASSRLMEEQARARGHAAGYTDGLRAGKAEIEERLARVEAERETAAAEARAQLDRAVSVLTAAATALHVRTLPLLDEVHGALAAAATDLAGAVLGYELADGPRSARAALHRALDGIEAHQVRTVRLHPDDLALLDDDTRTRAGVEFTADASLERGDAVTEFPDGYLDARIGTALDRAKVALLEENR
jgi:flagellar assembly protein FliH